MKHATKRLLALLLCLTLCMSLMPAAFAAEPEVEPEAAAAEAPAYRQISFFAGIPCENGLPDEEDVLSFIEI